MVPRRFAVMLMATALSVVAPVSAADPDRDFSGKWTLDPAASRLQSLGMETEPVLLVVQQEDSIRCSNHANYKLDGSETRYQAGAETRSTAVKWEGAALLINTLVSGTQDYTVMDRWRLSPDHATLTITRQVVRGTNQVEGLLVYRSEQYAAPQAPRPMQIRPQPRPVASPAAPAELVVTEGTRIALALRNSVDTKHSKEGDRVYLETIYPVAREGRIVIPPGSFVNGTITVSKPAGRVKGKGELYIRFDSLTLPNGVTRDFRSRLGSAEGQKVDREEGKVTGERDKGRDARTVATTTGMGASIGGLIGASQGHALGGVGIGGAAGAAAGLAGVLMKKGPDATLRQGTTMEMILDREIRFTPEELR
jgi:hypothetical protein